MQYPGATSKGLLTGQCINARWISANLRSDIKPHNCLLHANGVLWLTDFGSSAPLLPSFCLHKSACLLPCGTADYIAPEILAFAEQAFLDAMSDDPDKTIKPGEGYSALCDWWSLGAVVYELVIGTAPFWAKRVEETYQRIMRYGVSGRRGMSCADG